MGDTYAPACRKCGAHAYMSDPCNRCLTGSVFDLEHLAYRVRQRLSDEHLSYRAAEPIVRVDHNTLQRVAAAKKPPNVENYLRIVEWLAA